MKAISLLLILFPISVLAVESSRDWSDTEGRKITGTLVAKSKDGATIKLAKNGKDVEIPLNKLSAESLEYIEKASLEKVPRFRAVTSGVKSNAAGTKKDARAVTVTVSDVGDRPCTAWIVWLGDGAGSGQYGVWKVAKSSVTEDGATELTATYDGQKSKFGENYRGWACGLQDDASGEWLAKTASMNAYLKFLTDDLKASK